MKKALYRPGLLLSLTSALLLVSVFVLGASRPMRATHPILQRVGAVGQTRVAVPGIHVDEGWETTIHVQNIGQEPVRAVMDVYIASTGDCSGEAVIGTLCSGLLTPGTAWTWTNGDLPPSAGSALVYSVLPGTEDAACGGNGTRQPGEPIAVTVDLLHKDPDTATSQSSSYTGITGGSKPDQTTGDYVYLVPLVSSQIQGWNTTITGMNVGETCAQVKVHYQPRDECAVTAESATFSVAPGTAVEIDPQHDLKQPFVGSAWIQSSQPLALLSDQASDPGALMTTAGIAQSDAVSAVQAPLVYGAPENWRAEIHVQNASADQEALGEVAFLDFRGRILTTASGGICPGGAKTFPIPSDGQLAGEVVDAVQVRSFPPQDTGGSPEAEPSIAAQVYLANDDTGQGVGYNAIPSPSGGTAAVALPALGKGGLRTSRVIIYNLNPTEGFTDLRIELYGAGGLQKSFTDRLGPAEVHFFNLSFLEWLLSGWTGGSGLVRAVGSTQEGGPSFAVIVQDRLAGIPQGDRSSAYVGVRVPGSMSTTDDDRTYLPLTVKNQ